MHWSLQFLQMCLTLFTANQETIVELMGFVNRVFPRQESASTTPFKPSDMTDANRFDATSSDSNSHTPIAGRSTFTPDTDNEADTAKTKSSTMRTEISFDFHRLNVLILRAVMRDNHMVGRKVGTFTMSEAKIHATLGNDIRVEGSLGGLQIIDLTPEGISHQRILSVGKDPLTDPLKVQPHQDLLSSLTQEVYGMSQQPKVGYTVDDQQALSFFVSRNLNATVTIRVRMASVWYTHCARFMQELNWCATEFKHYLKYVLYAYIADFTIPWNLCRFKYH